MQLVTADEMRALDRLTIEKYGVPGYALMERAGRGATRFFLDCFPQRHKGRVVVCAGRGNNGGDGFIVARELRRKKIPVDVFLLGEKSEVRGDAARALASYLRAGGKIQSCRSSADLAALEQRLRGARAAVDAVFGTGLKGEVSGVPAEVIGLLNRAGVPCFAVDIASGLDSDRGVPLGAAVEASATATFGFAKIGQVVYPGASHTGSLCVVDIGIAAQAIEERPPQARLLEDAEMARLVPKRTPTAHKGDAGHLLIISGGIGKTGAAMLSARAAGRTGAGLVTVGTPNSQQPIVAGGLREAMSVPLADVDGELGFEEAALARLVDGKSAVAIGPGIGTGDGARKTVAWLLDRCDVPLVLDADALNCLAGDLRRVANAKADVVLTPHPGEMARLIEASTPEVQADRIGTARRTATEHGCTVLLKGARTVIAEPDGKIAINPTGNPGMASGGMGDVLTGIIGALLAQGLTTSAAACLGAYAHGRAADGAAAEIGPIGIVAGDVGERMPRVLAELAAGL